MEWIDVNVESPIKKQKYYIKIDEMFRGFAYWDGENFCLPFCRTLFYNNVCIPIEITHWLKE